MWLTNSLLSEKMMTQDNLKPCYEVQPLLDEVSVNRLLQEIANVLGNLSFNEHELDDSWINGCRAYGWVKNHLETNYKSIPGVSILSDRMDFVFCLNTVPLQFITDKVDSPRKRHRLLRNDAEFQQMSLFSDIDKEQEITWRIFAEKSFDACEPGEDILPTWVISLAGFTPNNVKISKLELYSKVSAPVTSADVTDLPEAADIPAAPLKRRIKDDQKTLNNEQNGTL